MSVQYVFEFLYKIINNQYLYQQMRNTTKFDPNTQSRIKVRVKFLLYANGLGLTLFT